MTTTLETSLRTIDLRSAGSAPEETATCCVAGCSRPTSKHKPYCLAHLDRLPYVQRIRQELEAQERVAGANDKRGARITPLRPYKKAI